MVSHLFFYQLTLIALVWLCVMLHWAWPSDPRHMPDQHQSPHPHVPKRHREPHTLCGPHHQAALRCL